MRVHSDVSLGRQARGFLIFSPTSLPVITSLVGLAGVSQPPRHMAASGVVMGPVNDTAPVVPFKHTVELHLVSRLERRDPGSKINIMSDQQCLPAGQAQNEALMLTPISVIRKHLGDGPATLHLDSTFAICDCAGQDGVGHGQRGGYRRNRVCSAWPHRVVVDDSEVGCEPDNATMSISFFMSIASRPGRNPHTQIMDCGRSTIRGPQNTLAPAGFYPVCAVISMGVRDWLDLGGSLSCQRNNLGSCSNSRVFPITSVLPTPRSRHRYQFRTSRFAVVFVSRETETVLSILRLHPCPCFNTNLPPTAGV